jgi:hypothetical protein
MTSKATILFSEEVSIFDLHLARLTEALGMQYRMVQIEHMNSLETFFAALCIMMSASSLVALFKNTLIPPDIIARVFEYVPFILVYGITPNHMEVSAVRHLTDGLVSSVVHLDRPDYVYQVSAAEREITKEFSGLTFGPTHPEMDFGLVLHRHQTGFSNLISINTLPLFGFLKKRNAQVFLLACHDIADLEAPTAGMLACCRRWIEVNLPPRSPSSPGTTGVRATRLPDCFKNALIDSQFASMVVTIPMENLRVQREDI